MDRWGQQQSSDSSLDLQSTSAKVTPAIHPFSFYALIRQDPTPVESGAMKSVRGSNHQPDARPPNPLIKLMCDRSTTMAQDASPSNATRTINFPHPTLFACVDPMRVLTLNAPGEVNLRVHNRRLAPSRSRHTFRTPSSRHPQPTGFAGSC